MPTITPDQNVSAAGRNFQAGVMYSVDDDTIAAIEAELAEDAGEVTEEETAEAPTEAAAPADEPVAAPEASPEPEPAPAADEGVAPTA